MTTSTEKKMRWMNTKIVRNRENEITGVEISVKMREKQGRKSISGGGFARVVRGEEELWE